jgi:hypothetical protein
VTYDQLGRYDHPEALATHASPIEESFWARLPTEAFRALFGAETLAFRHHAQLCPAVSR